IRKATDLARRMVVEYGMSKRLGAVDYSGSERSANPFGIGAQGSSGASGSSVTAETIEAEVRAILERCHQRAREILRQNRVHLEEMAMYLLEKEVLDGDVMDAFLAQIAKLDSLEDRPITETEELGRTGPL